MFSHLPKWMLRGFRFGPRLAYALGLGPLIGRLVLLLTTTGRKSGLPRVTALQYEMIDDTIYIASARGTKADWYRNIVADAHVRVRVKRRRFEGIAVPCTDPASIADFLEIRLKRHPRMVGRMMQMDGMSSHPTHDQLLFYARRLALVMIRPESDHRVSDSVTKR